MSKNRGGHAELFPRTYEGRVLLHKKYIQYLAELVRIGKEGELLALPISGCSQDGFSIMSDQ